MASGGTISKTRKQPSAEIRVTPLRIPDISVVPKTLLIRAYYPNSDRIKSDGTYAHRYDPFNRLMEVMNEKVSYTEFFTDSIVRRFFYFS